jgi:hypothetical protein
MSPAIDLVAAAVDAPAGVVKHAIFGIDLVGGRTPTRGVVFSEDLVKIAGQQGRYAVGHDSLWNETADTQDALRASQPSRLRVMLPARAASLRER